MPKGEAADALQTRVLQNHWRAPNPHPQYALTTDVATSIDAAIAAAGGFSGDLSLYQTRIEKGIPNGYAPLDGSNLLPATHLPGFLNQLAVLPNGAGGLTNDGSGGLSWVLYQPLDADLTAIAALTGTGIAVRTAADTWAQRSLVAPAAGVTIANPAGIAGDPTLTLANDLAALEGLAATGFAARIATDTWAQRSLTAPAAGLTINNPAGVAGNPTFALANDLAALEALAGTGIAVRTGADTWAQRAITGSATIAVTNGDGVAGNPTLAITGGSLVSGLTSPRIPYAASATSLADNANLFWDTANLALVVGTDPGTTARLRVGGDVAINGDVTVSDAKNIILNATTGTKIGTATTQKLGFWNATPVAQYATVGTLTGFAAGAGGTAAKDVSTWTGNTGTSAYTTNDIVRALKFCGILAA
jgi:hypothetical protein